MINNNYQFSLKTVLLLSSMFVANSGFSEGFFIELSHTIEEAKISVSPNDDKTSGSLTATLLICDGCTPKTYTFDQSTVFLNQFGASKPIEELHKWSGSRAMFHFRKADNHIEQLKILP